MQTDIVYLQSKLVKIEGASSLGDKLLELVNAKHIAEPAVESEAPEKTESASDKQDSEKEAESSSS
jgi:vacuolar protein sorting-associated protein 54